MALKKTQKFRNITWTTLRLSRIWGTLLFGAFRTSYRARPFCADELKGQLVCPINVKPEIHWVTINTLLISSSLQISTTPPTFLISMNHTTGLSHRRPEWYLTFVTLISPIQFFIKIYTFYLLRFLHISLLLSPLALPELKSKASPAWVTAKAC